MKINKVILVFALLPFILILLINASQFIEDTLVLEYYQPVFYPFISSTVCITLLIVLFIKRFYFRYAACLLFIFSISLIKNISFGPSCSDCDKPYIYKGEIDIPNISKSDVYTVAMYSPSLCEQKVSPFPNSFKNYDVVEVQNEFDYTHYFLKNRSDSSVKRSNLKFYNFDCFDTITEGRFEMKGKYYWDCSFNPKAKIKRIKQFPLKVYKNGVGFKDCNLRIHFWNVYDSSCFIVINFGTIKIQ